MGRLVETIHEGRVIAAEVDDTGSTRWNPNYIGDGFHIEDHRDGRWHNRVRLEPIGYDALLREIKRWEQA